MTQTLIIIILIILLFDGHGCCIDGFEIIVPLICIISFPADCRRSISPL